MYFIYLADQLVRRGRRDAAMDDLFDHIDAFMRAGDFVTLNMILQSLHPCTLELDTVLGILTASLPARSKIPSRKKFFDSAVRSFQNEPGLFSGLE